MVPIEKIGPKRVVVGAHYGTGEFIIQRVTAIILAIYRRELRAILSRHAPGSMRLAMSP